jgi:chlorophyll(ide) b reductase
MAAAVVHLSVHGRLRRSPEIVSQKCYRPSLLRCRAFKQETGGDDEKPSSPPPKRRKGPLYKLKAALQGLAGSRSAAAEVYGGQYERAVEKAEEIFFSVSSVRQPSTLRLL